MNEILGRKEVDLKDPNAVADHSETLAKSLRQQADSLRVGGAHTGHANPEFLFREAAHKLDLLIDFVRSAYPKKEEPKTPEKKRIS